MSKVFPLALASLANQSFIQFMLAARICRHDDVHLHAPSTCKQETMQDKYDQVRERLNQANGDLSDGKIRAFSCYEDSEGDLVVNVIFVLPDPPENSDNWDMRLLDELCAKAKSHLKGLAFSDCWFRTQAEFDDDQESDWVFIDHVAADG